MKYPSLISQGMKVISLIIPQNINIRLIYLLEEKVFARKENRIEKIAVIMKFHKSWY